MHLRSVVIAVLMAVATVVIGPPVGGAAASGDVLMVVAAPGALTSGEVAVRTRMTSAGYTVRVADDDTVTAAETAGTAFVLITQSPSSNAGAVKALAGLAVPIWVAKPYLFDDFGLTGVTTSEYGDKPGSQLTIADPTHPMAAGRSGTVNIQSGGRVSWGRPAASATVIARNGADAAAFTVAPGAPLANGAAAPACRVTFPVYGNAPATFTADGWAMFDATVAWTAGNCRAAPPVDAPPTVTVTAPASGAVVRGTVPLSADAADDIGVAQVRFSVDGVEVGVDAAAPFSVLWASGGVSPGPHTVSATVTDTGGQSTAASVPITVQAVTAPRTVLLVVANPTTPTPGEVAVRDRLGAAGFSPTLADDNAVTASQAAGTAFVLVSQSVNANLSTVTSLAGVSVPVWVAKPFLFDDFGLTGRVAGTDYADKPGSTVTVVDSTHPMAAGRSGTLSIQSGGRMSVGRPTAAATVVALAGTDASVFTLSAGRPTATGTPAPGCRLSFPVYGNAPTTFTADGWAMFDAAAQWAAADCTAGTPVEPGPVRHVVLVSVDGLNPQAITQLGPAGAPAFHRLVAEGVSTLNARTVFEATQTLPDHTSMITGRPVTVAGGHRVTFNEDNGSTVHASAGQYVTSVFDLVHDAGGRTALYTGKTKFDFFDRSWNGLNGAPDVTGVDDGRDKIDTYLRSDEEATTQALITALQTDPAEFSMIHYPGPDGVGHGQGFMSTAYVAEVSATDALIGRILDAVAADPGLAASTVVVVTSDHGGLGLSHADPTLAVDYTVPFFAWGVGTEAGLDLYALNPDRSDPGGARPDYSGPQPVRNAEVGNLITGLLGYAPIPGSLINAGQTLDLAG